MTTGTTSGPKRPRKLAAIRGWWTSPRVPRAAVGLAIALLIAASAPTTPAAEGTPAVGIERRLHVMGTRATVEVSAADHPTASAAAEAAVRALEETAGRLSTWGEDSELLAFQVALRGGPTRPGRLLGAELRAALECARRTDGAFDPTVGALVEAWGLRSGGRTPSASELAAARRETGHTRIRIGAAGAWEAETAGLRFEEGGFGKGAGLDRALEAARAAGAASARIDLGGQLAAFGAEREVAVADPDRRDRPVAVLRLGEGSVATTGNSERGSVVDGSRLGHVLDPRTGRPAEDFGSVTVVAPTGLEADCLATGLFVLGPEEALRRAEAWPGVEVLVVRRGSAGPALAWTPGLAGRVEPLASTDPQNDAPHVAALRTDDR